MSTNQPPPPAASNPEDNCGDVLIVDDFVDALTLYEALLTEDGYRVRTATGGGRALELVAEREPELVLLDVSMPGMDGLEVLRRLRSLRGGGPAVIMLTAARREPRAIEAGLREGADAYLTKPIDGRELLARTRGALESFRLRRLLEGQRRDHVAMLVHDLRHPLSSLGLVAEVLDADDLSDEERRSAVATIRGLSKEMARLIDGVLAASRLEAGVFSVEPRHATAGDVLATALSVFSPIASRRRISLVFEGSFEQPVFADVPKLQQAIDNLLANALKFTPKGGRVKVRVTRERSPAGQVMVAFEVSDTGPGIAESERPHIFDRYQQGSRGRAAGGAGLGLAIARGIAEAHGGGVSVETGSLGGASFKVTVPE